MANSAHTPVEQIPDLSSTPTSSDPTPMDTGAKVSKFDPCRYRDVEQVRMEDLLAGGQKTQTIIPVRKPNRKSFVRVHPEPSYQVRNLPTLLEESTGDVYLLGSELRFPPDLENKIDYLNLATAITTDGSIFLWHYKNSTNSWSDSARIAQARAMHNWVRVIADKSSNGYMLESPLTAPADPAWPSLTFPQILETAFGSRLIESLNHPLVKKLRGEF